MNVSPWRFPLQTGEGAVRALWLSALLWLPGTILAVVLYFVAARAELLFTLIFLPGLIAFGFWRLNLSRAREMRPSDLELSPSMLRVRGGAHDAFDIPLAKVTDVVVRRATRLLPAIWQLIFFSRDDRDDAEDLHVLMIQKPDGSLVRLAMTRAPAELASFEELAATIRAATTPPPPVAHELPPQVLRCPSCQGPVAPSTDEALACPWCTQRLSTTSELREKVKAAEIVASHSFEAVRAVLEQPPAASLAPTFKWLTIVLMSVWGVGYVGLLVGMWNGVAFRTATALVSLFVFGTVTAGFAFFRALLNDRQALRVLTMHFAAVGPEKQGAPRTCRQCHGPLADAGTAAMVTCVWCSAPNLLGADLRLEASAVGEERRSLEQVLAARQARRTSWRLVAALGALCLVGGVGAFVWALLDR